MSFWLNVWETWYKQKNIVNKIEENEPEKLNKLLEKFYADVKNKNGDDYEPPPTSSRITFCIFGTKVTILKGRRHLNTINT